MARKLSSLEENISGKVTEREVGNKKNLTQLCFWDQL